MRKKITRKAALAAGLSRYFTGKPCPQGHVAQRITANGYCTICNEASKRRYDHSPLGQDRYFRHNNSPLGQDRFFRYNHSPKGEHRTFGHRLKKLDAKQRDDAR